MMTGGLAGSRACDGTDAVSYVCPLLIRGFGFESRRRTPLTWEPISATWREPGSPVTPHWKVRLEVQDGSVTLSDGQPRENARSPADMASIPVVRHGRPGRTELIDMGAFLPAVADGARDPFSKTRTVRRSHSIMAGHPVHRRPPRR